MDALRFDALARTLTERGTRRGLLVLLATLPLVRGLLALLDADGVDAKGRRKRHKKPHHHRKHTGNHKGKGQHTKKRKHKKTCQPEAKSTTCAGTCGPVQNNCKKTVDCGPCDCDPPCETCETCMSELVCEPCDPCCDDVCCTQANAICHVDTGACCVPDSTAQTCDGQCGDVVNNCGITVDCGPCICSPSCPACQICDEESGDCIPEPSQEGESCGTCQVCNGEGQCAGCSDCCDGNGDCQPGTTDAACGSSGTCDVCTGQEECQSQSCVCVPACGGKICGPDGCNGTCDPGCSPNSTCSGNGTICNCDFSPCDDICCADGESCCGSDCVDLDTDPDHCGNCSTACPGSQVCQGGVCGFACGNDFCPAPSEICDAGSCQACTVCPSCASTTVQQGIDATGPGGTVRICAGIYTRNGTNQVAFIQNNNLTLIGAGAGNGGTILDGEDVESTLSVLNCSVICHVRQLTVTGSNGGPGIFVGGPTTLTDVAVTGNTRGIRAPTAKVTLNAGTIVSGNTTGGRGGGILTEGAALTMNAGSRVSGNSAGITGGGISIEGSPSTLDPGSLVCGNTPNQCAGAIIDPHGVCQATCPP